MVSVLISNALILCVYTYCMAQLDIYIKDEDKIKLIRKASRMNISVSKLMVGAALKCDKIVLEDVKDDTE